MIKIGRRSKYTIGTLRYAINREEYIKVFEDDANMLKPISMYYGIDHNSLNLYDADICVGFRVFLNPLPSLKSAVEFFYALSNLF